MRILSIAVIVVALAAGAARPAQAVLEFSQSGNTLDLYYSGVLVETLGPVSTRCGANAANWASFSLSGLSLGVFDAYGGGGGCAYCGCTCVEAQAVGTAMLRMILYVDPVTGLPRNKSLGGVPVTKKIPFGSTLAWGAAASTVFQCNGSYQYGDYWGQALIKIGPFVSEQHERDPICGSSGLGSTILSGNGVPILMYIAMTGSHCSHAQAHVDFPNATVYVPATQLEPDPPPGSELIASATNTTLRIRNLTSEPLESLIVRLYAPTGGVLDSLVVPSLPGASTVEWTLSLDMTNVAVRTSASMAGAPVSGVEDAAWIYQLNMQAIPFTLLDRTDGAPNQIELRRIGSVNYGHSKVGYLEAEKTSALEPGISIQPTGLGVSFSDEFDAPNLSSAWTVENTSAPQSVVSTSERLGFLRLRATATGGGSVYWGNNHRMPRVVQGVRGDWVFETRLHFNPDDGYEGAGIFLNGDRWIQRTNDVNQSPPNSLSLFGQVIAYPDSAVSLKLSQFGDSLRCWYSPDGISWTEGPRQRMLIDEIGLYAIRFDQVTGNAHDAIADFEYVRFASGTVDVQPTVDASQIVRVIPQPASGKVTLSFTLAEAATVSATIVDVQGRIVRNLPARRLPAGPAAFDWDGHLGSGAPAARGVYYARVLVNRERRIGRIVLM